VRAWRRRAAARSITAGRETLLAGPHGPAARDLIAFLAAMTLADAAVLLARVERGPWREANADTRFEILELIDDAIVELRERAGLAPFRDPLPGQPPNVFLLLREALR
jgi:hypothetical protein